jgi:hypothetical protein
MISEHQHIIGQKYIFEDGDSIEVIQIKWRGEENFLVTYHVQQGPGIPRKLVMELNEFMGTYGYLFGEGEPPEPGTPKIL